MRNLLILLSLLLSLGQLSAQNKKTLTAGLALGYTTGLNAIMYAAEGQYFFKKNLALRVEVDYAEDRLTVADGELRYVYLTNMLMLNAELVKSLELLSVLKLYGFAGVQVILAQNYVHGNRTDRGVYPGLTGGIGAELTPLPLIKPFVQVRGAYIPGSLGFTSLHHLALSIGVRIQLQEGKGQ